MIPESVKDVLIRIHQINSRFSKFNSNYNVSFQKMVEKAQTELFEEMKSNSISISISNEFDSIIEKASLKYNIPFKLIKSIIKQESNFNPKAVSPKGAKGLMQIMPETAELLGINDVFNPEENIFGGVRYLKMLLDKFNGDYIKALAAYNAGPEIVEKYNGIPDFKETQNYVKNILNYLNLL